MKTIIFIPGIESTALANTNTFNFDVVWNGYDNLGTSLITNELGPNMAEGLQLDGLYDANEKVIIERNHIARLPYQSTIQNLEKIWGDKARIFLFGYDWRLSNVENGKRLKVYFDYLRAKLKKTKSADDTDGFSFLTHSMGGLVLMNFANELNEQDRQDIDKIMMIAPPLIGSPYALIHLVRGDGGLKGFFNHIFGRNADVRKVLRTYPSVFELLPYYKNAISFDDNNEEADLLNIYNWQSNLIKKSDDEIQPFDFIKERLRKLCDYRNIKMTLPETLADKTIIVVGESDDNDTSTYVQTARTGNKVDNFLLLDKIKDGYSTGDGTVPLISGTALKDKILTIAVMKESIFKHTSDYSFHGLMLQDSRVQNIIKRYFMNDKKYTVDTTDIEDLKSVDGKQRIVN